MSIRQHIAVYERNHAFSETEAWFLFRAAAFAEAVGWTLLITGICIEHFTGSHAPVAVAGRIHGTLFFGYLVAAALYPNLGWGRWRALFALAASVPPYGSLIFELWARYQRDTKHAAIYHHYMTFTMLAQRAS